MRVREFGKGPRRDRHDSGQALVELALILPIMIVLAIAVGDFGRVYATGVAVEDAAREAADYTAFDDVSASHLDVTDPNDVLAKDSVRQEALRRACAAVSALPDYGSPGDPSSVAAHCADTTASCQIGPGTFCQLVMENHRTGPLAELPWSTKCDGVQTDVTCGWVVHTTIRFDFHMIIDYLPLDWMPVSKVVNFTRESRYAISALPTGVSPSASPAPTP